MNPVFAVLLGLVQGVSEWLPISSKTQVLFASTLLFSLPLAVAYAFGLFMEIGSLSSAVVYFRKDIWSLFNNRKLFIYLLVATTFTAIVGCPPVPDTDKCSPTFSSTIYSIPYQFTVDFPPGTYSYYCSFHPTTMVGNFIVQPPPGPDFGVSSNPSSLTILQGSKANSTITVTSLNDFAGPVTLSSSPSSPPGLMTSSFSRNPVTVPAGGTANSNFTISVPANTSPGSYSLTVTGSNSTTSRNTSVSVSVTAPDFTIISSPSSLNIPQGSSGTTTITLTSLNGFSGTVSLTSTVSSSGPQATFSPASVAVPSGGSISSTLSVYVASSGAYSTPVSQGSYTVTVTGTSGSLVHSTALSLTVGSSSGVGGLPSVAIIGGGIAVAIAAVASLIYVLRRKSKTKT